MGKGSECARWSCATNREKWGSDRTRIILRFRVLSPPVFFFPLFRLFNYHNFHVDIGVRVCVLPSCSVC